MKKLIIILALFTLRSCEPAPAATIQIIQNETYVTMGRSDDGKRIKIKFQTDFSGNVCTYCNTYVWTGSSWAWASAGEDSFGNYVNYMGTKYYF